jgi:hypothetical protein
VLVDTIQRISRIARFAVHATSAAGVVLLVTFGLGSPFAFDPVNTLFGVVAGYTGLFVRNAAYNLLQILFMFPILNFRFREEFSSSPPIKPHQLKEVGVYYAIYAFVGCMMSLAYASIKLAKWAATRYETRRGAPRRETT